MMTLRLAFVGVLLCGGVKLAASLDNVRPLPLGPQYLPPTPTAPTPGARRAAADGLELVEPRGLRDQRDLLPRHRRVTRRQGLPAIRLRVHQPVRSPPLPALPGVSCIAQAAA